MSFKRSDFPAGFTFGVSTSSYQIEGHGFGGAGRTHWDDFAATPGNVVRAEDGRLACDHYHRYEADLDLISAAGFDAYRFSTSWARVMPDGRTVNPEGLDFYDRLTDAMLACGLRPFATLYHWEMPSALVDLGGWQNRDVADWFADFTEVLMRRIGDRMHAVAPINEPWCVAWLGHFLGEDAPGMRNVRATARTMHHVLLAHGRAVAAMRALGMKNLGGVFNFEWAEPADDSEATREAAELYDGIYNRWFLGGVFNGAYPENVVRGLEPYLPAKWQDDFDTISAPLDWCGLNYYTRRLIAAADGPWPGYREVEGPLPKTFMDWEIYPEGLYRFLKRTADEYAVGLPLYITENGMAADDRIVDGAVSDADRIAYLDAHFAQAKRAIAEGVPLAGYFIWSLMDNYEWALGYEKRFGIVHVDFDSYVRTPKDSYRWLANGLTGNTV